MNRVCSVLFTYKYYLCKAFKNTHHSHYRSLLAMGVPIMVGQLGVILTGFVDNIMVGHHTTAELSAASFVNNIFMLPLMFATGFAMGITPLIGEQTGRNELPQAGQIFRYGLFANGILAASLILIMGTLYFFLDRMGLPQERFYCSMHSSNLLMGQPIRLHPCLYSCRAIY